MNAIGKLIIPTSNTGQSKHATAWLFTDNGFMLSSGHVFDEINAQISEKFTLIFPGEISHTAELLEYSYQPSAGIDYAVLFISDAARFQRFEFIKISKFSRQNIGKSIYVHGYRSEFLEAQVTSIAGRVQPLISNGTMEWCHLQINNHTRMDGMSGGPVVSSSDGSAFAIQHGQNSLGAKSDILASIISRLPSPIIQSVLSNKRLLKPGGAGVRRLPGLNFTHITSAPKTRVSLLVNDHLSADRNLNKIYNGHTGVAAGEKFREKLRKSLENLQQHFSEGLQVVYWDFVRLTAGSIKGTLSDGVSLLKSDIPSIEDDIRIVIDLTGSFIKRRDEKLERVKNNISHLIGIEVISGDQNSFEIKSNNNFDTVFTIFFIDADYALSCIMNIIRDISLDISIAYSTVRGIKDFSVEQKRNLSFQKAKFLQAYPEFKVYGKPIPKTGYISFAFTSRHTLHAESVLTEYPIIWEEFLLDYQPQTDISAEDPVQGNSISMPSSQRFDLSWHHTEGISINEIAKRIKGIKKIGEQISSKKLITSLRLLKKKQLYVFCVLIKKPRKEEYRRILEGPFGKSKQRYSLYMFTFLTPDELKNIVKCKHLLYMSLINIS